MEHSESGTLSYNDKKWEVNSDETTVAINNFRINDDDYDDDIDERVMNDSTMPPPKNLPQTRFLEHKSQRIDKAATTTSTAGTNNNVSIAHQRKKVGRFGLSDWTRLLSVSNDLAQRKGRPLQSKITWKEIKKHNSMHDGWMVIKGKVYNVAPYLPYHPGGEKILKSSLGRDGTALYEKYHRWVNEDGYVKSLLIWIF
jgi:cytochrome b involved in lipid metabolism